MLVRTTKRIAGFPPPGVVGEVDDDRAARAVARGDAEDMSKLGSRIGATPGLGEQVGGFLPPRGDEVDIPLGDVSTPGGVEPKRPKAKREAKPPTDDA